MDIALQPAFLAEASTLLILLAGALFLYRSFRERYLVYWIAGWTVHTLARLFAPLSESLAPQRLWAALSYAGFVAAVGLFAGAVFLYVNQRRLLWPASIVLAPALGLGVAGALWLPHSVALGWAFRAFYLSVLLAAAFNLARF